MDTEVDPVGEQGLALDAADRLWDRRALRPMNLEELELQTQRAGLELALAARALPLHRHLGERLQQRQIGVDGPALCTRRLVADGLDHVIAARPQPIAKIRRLPAAELHAVR